MKLFLLLLPITIFVLFDVCRGQGEYVERLTAITGDIYDVAALYRSMKHRSKTSNFILTRLQARLTLSRMQNPFQIETHSGGRFNFVHRLERER